ncbi:hypothetical protein [Maricaulis sp.]|uniref:hypothetical protein n=1 Tax=Maricaulis sp. TaxID=1486257 RepID=UPI00262294E7|nr:hypothetical protein [Maricaulis sp.]MDF1769838.1 hypothetical protein [Maricaulis sp.]
MAKEPMVTIEVFADGEVATGLVTPEHKYCPEGSIIQAPKSAAESLIAVRRARPSSKKVSLDLYADPEKVAAAVQKLNEANEAAREAGDAGEGEG